MEPIDSPPPREHVHFSRAQWVIHRNNAKFEEPSLYVDYEIEDGDYIKYFPYEIVSEKALGASCFVPLGEPKHKSPVSKRAPCYFLPKGTPLPDGLALVYTGAMVLRFPKIPKVRKTGWHFLIVPTKRMTKYDYIRAVKDLDWHICEIKATADPDELVRDNDDMNDIKDFRMVELYWLMFNWYKQTTDYMDRLHANYIHTWIALNSPSFKELLQHKPRACIVFSALARMNTPTVTLETYKYDILNELEEAFGWDEEKFLVSYMEPEIKMQELNESVEQLVQQTAKLTINQEQPVEGPPNEIPVIEEINDSSSIARNNKDLNFTAKNILLRVFLDNKIQEGDEVKYGDDHICFLTVREDKPCITYKEVPYYSIDAFLKAYLELTSRKPPRNPNPNERSPFSIRDKPYDELKLL